MKTAPPRILPARIARIGLNVADLDASIRFYVEGLGFRHDGTDRRTDADIAALSLGEQRIELVRHDQPGARYPRRRAANDPWFQHFAIVVSDMARAYARLADFGHQPISAGGPQQLPPETGSVIAYKFRDPDGHPLELSYLPGSAWLDPDPDPGARPGDRLFLGIDHSGLAVADLDQSIAFYADLGFTETARLLNRGDTQERLDGLAGAEVDIVVLEAEGGGPHLELLCYRPLSSRPVNVAQPNDIAATRLILRGEGERVVIDDPDGHLVELRRS